MAYVSVDVDLDDFETYEMVDELVRRMRRDGRKKLDENQKELLRNEVKALYDALNFSDSDTIQCKTLEDQMKIEHMSKVWNKYTSQQIESLLP